MRSSVDHGGGRKPVSGAVQSSPQFVIHFFGKSMTRILVDDSSIWLLEVVRIGGFYYILLMFLCPINIDIVLFVNSGWEQCILIIEPFMLIWNVPSLSRNLPTPSAKLHQMLPKMRNEVHCKQRQKDWL